MYVLVVGFRHMRASMSSKRRRSRLRLQATSSQIVRRLTAGEHLSLQGLRRLATPETIREDLFSCREKLEAPALRPCSEEERTNAFPCAALLSVGLQVWLTAANRVSSRQSTFVAKSRGFYLRHLPPTTVTTTSPTSFTTCRHRNSAKSSRRERIRSAWLHSRQRHFGL